MTPVSSLSLERAIYDAAEKVRRERWSPEQQIVAAYNGTITYWWLAVMVLDRSVDLSVREVLKGDRKVIEYSERLVNSGLKLPTEK